MIDGDTSSDWKKRMINLELCAFLLVTLLASTAWAKGYVDILSPSSGGEVTQDFTVSGTYELSQWLDYSARITDPNFGKPEGYQTTWPACYGWPAETEPYRDICISGH